MEHDEARQGQMFDVSLRMICTAFVRRSLLLHKTEVELFKGTTMSCVVNVRDMNGWTRRMATTATVFFLGFGFFFWNLKNS